jgi:hypothetical protein
VHGTSGSAPGGAEGGPVREEALRPLLLGGFHPAPRGLASAHWIVQRSRGMGNVDDTDKSQCVNLWKLHGKPRKSPAKRDIRQGRREIISTPRVEKLNGPIISIQFTGGGDFRGSYGENC